MVEHFLDIQSASNSSQLPTAASLQLWVKTALASFNTPFELVLRIVDIEEMSELNQTYRQKSGPTNILSFPFEAPEGIEMNHLGDLVVCAPVVEREASEQGKALLDHWAHITIHVVLHLLGYDHIDDSEAEEMENLEITLLQQLQINNPYQEQEEL